MGIKVGIDLGTTNSAIAYIKDGKPVIIENKEGDRTTPSVVQYRKKDKDKTGDIYVIGKQAKNASMAMPHEVVFEAKRLMGTDQRIVLGEKTFRAEEISARVLQYLVDSAKERTGQQVDEAVITVPAYFNDTQRRATQKAAEIVGLKVERIINEPTAAAIAFAFENLNQQRNILIYDLGGGTFDVSIVEVFESMIEVKASSGNNHLGGKDFDELLANYIIEKFADENEFSLKELPDYAATMVRLKMGAESLKIQLSQQEVANVNLPFVGLYNGMPVSLNMDISRLEFENLIRKLVESTIDKVKEALGDSKLDLSEITDVVMVGGSTRIPLVRKTVENYYGRPVRTDINPDEVVALGAALQMGLKSQDADLRRATGGGMMVVDVSPYSLGTEVSRSLTDSNLYYDQIIPRNTTIPAVKRATYHTMHDNQESVEINVFQAEKYTGTETPTSPGVTQLNEYPIMLENLPPRPAGQVGISVEFKYNMNGILEVNAEVIGFGIQKSIEIRPTGGMSHFETREAAATLEKDVTKTALYNRMKPIILRAEQMKKTASGDDRDTIERLLETLKDAMHDNNVSLAEKTEAELTDVLIDLM